MKKIHLTFDDQVITATLADHEAARAFIAMLPMTVTLHDLFGREKFGAIAHAIGHAEPRSQRGELGDLICWSAGPDLAVLYAQHDAPLCGGFHKLGRIDAGAQAFAVPGPLVVTIALKPAEPRCSVAERRRTGRPFGRRRPA
ncbi:cyclophilin-like fold protein [Xylophilus sp. GOD-11R]|uniref:cyclophilin-like fold protein n=1 Tax=Xylophilus sp. GOD-11R TaxID=3089814 RepID=UPI00298CDEC3|nr:cyclophilin-like fold protein [Xylophilus sp. GOD-11R]WPB55371.1 cyclophilin-like fold protein [Xylophilus sp. GOD-11R]